LSIVRDEPLGTRWWLGGLNELTLDAEEGRETNDGASGRSRLEVASFEVFRGCQMQSNEQALEPGQLLDAAIGQEEHWPKDGLVSDGGLLVLGRLRGLGHLGLLPGLAGTSQVACEPM
jgi:hypothetical protein